MAKNVDGTNCTGYKLPHSWEILLDKFIADIGVYCRYPSTWLSAECTDGSGMDENPNILTKGKQLLRSGATPITD